MIKFNFILKTILPDIIKYHEIPRSISLVIIASLFGYDDFNFAILEGINIDLDASDFIVLRLVETKAKAKTLNLNNDIVDEITKNIILSSNLLSLPKIYISEDDLLEYYCELAKEIIINSEELSICLAEMNAILHDIDDVYVHIKRRKQNYSKHTSFVIIGHVSCRIIVCPKENTITNKINFKLYINFSKIDRTGYAYNSYEIVSGIFHTDTIDDYPSEIDNFATKYKNTNQRILPKPTYMEYLGYDGAHCHNLWEEIDETWRCPACRRSKFEIMRWAVIKLNSSTKRNQWRAILHRHHDHGFKERFPETIICDQCNAVDGTAKRKLNLPKGFSFSPIEISQFIIAKYHQSHIINYERAKNIYDRVRKYI